MRQHVNPLSSNFNQIERIPSLNEMFGDSKLNLHLDIGCAAGEFLFEVALINTKRIYMLPHKLINLFLGNNKMHNIHNYDNSNFKSNSLMFNYYVFKKKKF